MNLNVLPVMCGHILLEQFTLNHFLMFIRIALNVKIDIEVILKCKPLWLS